ncbi:RimJ/RimL family protein N-acetyltransferase [Bifidobacterium commune]|uniref:Protein N-acetyltransferase, RimJ/RimL family n=1 Tax=Bifidobacterium commune TaxID=1505727 RepID=A0A1C4H602_9BIFI|nr:GNAT family N-acetyltransferase [Bifidobacterium commune]MBB2955825.1 RimJ/RimL family protein N-acetyltransferase [Bifidobacterium commune]SCC80080.1 Protein N-acetyltransferase, RimJ/RimL family [Bifidobacterium commune]
MSENSEISAQEDVSRQLPERVVIPEIRGEMVHLRPATLDDISKLDQLDAYFNASGDTGKDKQSERALVQEWIRRSVAWTNGSISSESGVGDPEARRTMAWAIMTDADHDADGKIDAESTGNVIGMIFLIDIDGWARSARIQVMLGKDYRGRGYSRDAMPRVMTYGFAEGPVGLGMHRIWVAVPEKSSRTLSVYQSLGFIKSGTSRDSLWDASIGKYQDLIILDTLADEYDPIRSLNTFGMHVIEGNPGVKEAMIDSEHSTEIKQYASEGSDASCGEKAGADSVDNETVWLSDGVSPRAGLDGKQTAETPTAEFVSDNTARHDSPVADADSKCSEGLRLSSVASSRVQNNDEQQSENGLQNLWPYSDEQGKKSKKAWWRNLGHSGQNKNSMDGGDLTDRKTSGGTNQ